MLGKKYKKFPTYEGNNSYGKSCLYIITSHEYIKDNIFKIDITDEFGNNLYTYDSDKYTEFFPLYSQTVYNSYKVHETLHELLENYVYNKEEEIYKIDYITLLDLVSTTIKNSNDFEKEVRLEKLKKNIKGFVENYIIEEDLEISEKQLLDYVFNSEFYKNYLNRNIY